MTDGADNGANGGVDDVPPDAAGSAEAASGPTVPPRNGFWAWLVFILAVGAVLALAGGCMAYMYGPLFTG
ncbi:hypothetical protein O4J56_18765 [Nocardiopsis sp. RSe5-2]|uniref:Uncharacterized protein n=1 Tax=Nocardiopsis endophytica TaxID=3018445 RepID=A0ABT4U6X3_9ACTN|nr:hypothetical protein [Nocardiopsis endophytica]MDA2812694.1 hypothetical protein [Nocardiopsis endophytica]